MAKAYSDRLPAATVHHLFALYGQQTPRVLALGDETPELLEPILAGQPDIKAQIVYAVRHEFARTLVDITRRRTALAIRCQYGDTALPVLADILARYCSWSAAECDRQIEAHHAYMQANCIPDYALPAIVSTAESSQPSSS
jgi:glycerol-3-phosphate dehydrogenase